MRIRLVLEIVIAKMCELVLQHCIVSSFQLQLALQTLHVVVHLRDYTVLLSDLPTQVEDLLPKPCLRNLLELATFKKLISRVLSV